MNLILSDVEETIMLVDVEGAPEGAVNVRGTLAAEICTQLMSAYRLQSAKWRCFSSEEMV